MIKPVIIAIVGASGSGKTTMAEFMKIHFRIPTIVSYTTRPMRPTEQNGREHYFVTPSDMPSRDKMLAYTLFGGHHYWALLSQVTNVCTYVIDEAGLQTLTHYYGDMYNIFKVNVRTNQRRVEQARIERDKDRAQFTPAFYDIVIDNNDTLSAFLKRIRNKMEKAFITNPIFEPFLNK